MFVRIKTIKGRPYGYLVSNEWTPWGSRQRVAKYLGRVFTPTRTKTDDVLVEGHYHDTILVLVSQELANHGFLRAGDIYSYGTISVNLAKKTVRNGKRDTVISMNEGFLCEHTLRELLSFTPEDRPDTCAKKLANLVLEAGLKLSEEQFVALFTTIDLKKTDSEGTQQ